MTRRQQSDLVIDVHAHVWNQQDGYGWLASAPPVLRRSYTIDDLGDAAASMGVDGIVLVEAGRGSGGETAALLELAAGHPLICAVVGDGSVADEISALSFPASPGQALLRGFRDSTRLPVPPIKAIRQLGRKVSGAMVIETTDPCGAPEVFFRCARMLVDHLFVIDHMGGVPSSADHRGRSRWHQTMLEASKLPNVYCKISGVLTNTAWSRHRRPCADVVDTLHGFGPERVLVGSDWPVCLVSGSYQQSLSVAYGLYETTFPGVGVDVASATAACVYSYSAGSMGVGRRDV